MAAAGSFKRPAAPAQHPPLRACPSRGARGGGLGRSGSSSRVGKGLGVGGRKLGLTPVHPDTARASPVTAPRVRSRAAGGGEKEEEKEEEAGAASGAELQQRRLLCCGRGAPEVRAWPSWGVGGRDGSRSGDTGAEGGSGMQMWRGGVGWRGDAEASGRRKLGTWTRRLWGWEGGERSGGTPRPSLETKGLRSWKGPYGVGVGG